MSLIAVVLAMGGTAWAAMYTGKNIKDRSLTGIDFRNSSLTGKDIKNADITARDIGDGRLAFTDFAASVRPSLMGGAGKQGIVGPAGDDALSQYSADFRDVKRLKNPTQINNDLPPLNWYRQNVIGVGGTTTVTPLNASSMLFSTQVLQLSAASNSSDPITVLVPSNLLVIANVELWHRADLGVLADDESDDDSRHTRAECQALVSGSNGSSGFQPIGVPVYVSSNTPQSVENITVTAGIRKPAGKYSARIACRSADKYTGSATDEHDWEFTGGNLVILAAKH